MNRIGLIIGGVLLALMLLSSTLFIVDQRQVAVVYALGEIKEVVQEPGLKFKLPPPFQNVVFLDRRIQTLDSAENRAIFTAEKKSLVIDWLVKWRISDPRQFIRNNGVDIRNLEARLSPVVHAAFNDEITKRTVAAVLSTERDKVVMDVRNRLAEDAKSFGIDVLDVRIKRVDFVANISESIYSRMAAERKQESGRPGPRSPVRPDHGQRAAAASFLIFSRCTRMVSNIGSLLSERPCASSAIALSRSPFM